MSPKRSAEVKNAAFNPPRVVDTKRADYLTAQIRNFVDDNHKGKTQLDWHWFDDFEERFLTTGVVHQNQLDMLEKVYASINN